MKKILLIAFLALTVVTGCKKDESPANNVPDIPLTGCFIKTIDDNQGELIAYAYNTENKVIKIEVFKDKVLNRFQTFDYGTNTITEKRFKGNGIADGQQGYETLNGRIVKETYTESSTNNNFTITYDDTYTYEYDTNGYLIKVNGVFKKTSNDPKNPSNSSTSTDNFSYNNGDLSEVSSSEKNGVNSYTRSTKFEYYTDKENIINLGYQIGAYDYYSFLYGKQSKHLIKSQNSSSIDVYNGTTNNYSDQTLYTYEYDTNGKPKKALETRSNKLNGGSTNSSNAAYNLTLNCK